MLCAVLLVMASIAMQGIVEPLRDVRVFMALAHCEGPFGVDGDPERRLIITGSAFWYCVHLVARCVSGVIVALLDPRAARSELQIRWPGWAEQSRSSRLG